MLSRSFNLQLVHRRTPG